MSQWAKCFNTHILCTSAREGEGYLLNSSLSLTAASQTLRHFLGNYCTHASSQLEPETFSSESKLLTTNFYMLEKKTKKKKKTHTMKQNFFIFLNILKKFIHVLNIIMKFILFFKYVKKVYLNNEHLKDLKRFLKTNSA